MADWYINPGLGTGTNAGTSWANAFNSTTTAWADAIAASSAGDRFFVNSASTCSNASAQTLTFKGTPASPNQVFSCSTITNNPPVAADLGAGAAFTTTGASGLTIVGCANVYGVVFNIGTGTSAANAILLSSSVASDLIFDGCVFNFLVTVAANALQAGAATNNVSGRITFNNTKVNFNGSTGSGIRLDAGCFFWNNTVSAIGGTQTALANLFNVNARLGVLVANGVDFTGVASAKNIIGSSVNTGLYQLINCRFTSGAVIATPLSIGVFVDIINCDSGATNYSNSRYQYQGTSVPSTTVYNLATDGVTPISWQVITTANAKRQSPFESFPIAVAANAGTYASTVVQITSADAALTNADIWVEVEYLGNASYPLASQVTSAPATLLTTGSSLSAGSWAQGSLGHNYVLTVPSFTTALAGDVRFVVKVAKASLTVNVDPKITVQ